MSSIMRLNGIPLIASDYLMVDGDPYDVKRSFRERWFSLPWRPWVKTKTIIPQIPDPNVYMFPPGRPERIIGHPATLQRIIEWSHNHDHP